MGRRGVAGKVKMSLDFFGQISVEFFYTNFARSWYRYTIKTIRIETHSSLFDGTFYLQPDRPCFFQSLDEKKIVTRNPGNTLGVSGHGSFFCLWAVRVRSAQALVLTEPWVTPPTAGAMKIEQGGACLHLITTLPHVAPLSFSWLWHFPVPQPLSLIAPLPGASASAIHYASTYHCAPLVWLVVALPSASNPILL